MTMTLGSERAIPAREFIVVPLLLAAGIVCLALVLGDVADYYGKLMIVSGVGALAAIAIWDSRTLRAPNRLVYPVAALLTIAPFGLGMRTGLDALGGGAIAFAILLVAVLAGRGAMGYGDAKVAYVCGALVGVAGTVPMLLLTFVLGFAVATVALTLRLRKRKDAIAFTPFLYLGVLLFLVVASNSVYVMGR